MKIFNPKKSSPFYYWHRKSLKLFKRSVDDLSTWLANLHQRTTLVEVYQTQIPKSSNFPNSNLSKNKLIKKRCKIDKKQKIGKIGHLPLTRCIPSFLFILNPNCLLFFCSARISLLRPFYSSFIPGGLISTVLPLQSDKLRKKLRTFHLKSPMNSV